MPHLEHTDTHGRILACDMVVDAPGGGQWKRLFATAIGLMALGWVMSCGTRWYDVDAEPTGGTEASVVAEHPVVPDRDAFSRWRAKLERRQWSAVLAEPPFVMPPQPRLQMELLDDERATGHSLVHDF